MVLDGLDPGVVSRFISQLVEQVTCIECCKYYITPSTADCGHTLCHGCWIGRHTCPICAAPVDRRALNLNTPMQLLTAHVHALGDAFEKLFGIKLDEEFVTNILDNNMDKDPTKNVKEWLANSQNKFSAPVLFSQKSAQDIVNPVELSTSEIQIHAHHLDKAISKVTEQKTSCPSNAINAAQQSQGDWDKIEIMPDAEKNDKEPLFIDNNKYTNENPRRSSRKRDINEDSCTRTREASIDKLSLKNSSGDTDKKSAKINQNWSNVKKMRKEFSKLNKKNRNKLNVSIEMCKKTQSTVSKPKPMTAVKPIALSQESCHKIDDHTPNINNENVVLTTKDTMTKISSDKLSTDNIQYTSISNKENNNNCIDGSNQGIIQTKKHTNSQCGEKSNFQRKEKESFLENGANAESSKSNKSNIYKNNSVKSANVPIFKKGLMHQNTDINQNTGDNCVKITQTEVDSTVHMNTDDVEISIKVGNTVTNILIKKKEQTMKVNKDRAIQTNLGPYALSKKNDASCSLIKESNKLQGKNKSSEMTQSSKSTHVTKKTESADTGSVHYEMTESVEKQLTNLLKCVESDNAKKSSTDTVTTSKSIQISKPLQVKDMKVPENIFEITEDVDNLNDLDIFGSGSVKEVNVQILKSTKYAPSEILPTFKSKKSQKVADKRNRDTNDEIEMPKNKKQKINFDKIEEIPVEVSLQEENQKVANDSENVSYDALMSQVFANIDADMKGQNKNTQNIKHSGNKNESPRTQIISKTQRASKDEDVSIEAGNNLNLKEFINQKYSENVFSVLEKDSEAIDVVTNKNVNQLPNQESTQEHIKNLLTPGICRDLASSARDDESEPADYDAEMMDPQLGTPMVDHDDSDKSVVEETPQKNLSFPKPKQKSDVQNVTDTSGEYTVVEINKQKQTLETPISINKFVDHITCNSTPVVRKSLNFESKNVDDPEETVCPASASARATQARRSSDQTICPTTTQEKEFLAKAFEPTPKSSTKRPSALRTKNRENTKLCLAGSCLTALESANVKKLCASRGWTHVDKYTNDLTHLVVGVDEENKSQRSVKYMCALAASKWIVSYAWADACARAGAERVDESPYEVLDGSGHPGPRRSRTAARKLFHGFTFYCMPPFGILDIRTLKYIVEEAGGRVVEEAREAAVRAGGAPALLLAEPEHTQEDRFMYLAMELGVVPVNYEWVLNCLGSYSLRSVVELALCPPGLLPDIRHWPHEMKRETDDD